MDPHTALYYIEATMKSTIDNVDPQGTWFKEFWKPRFDIVRAGLISPELKQAMHEVISEIMDHEPWDPPFDQLQ